MAKQTIGEFLATLRKANGYTQQEVADRLGISNRTLSGWECDKVLPDILLLPALAELYGVTVDEILCGERKEKEQVNISGKSVRGLLKNKLSHFGYHANILVGLIATGIILMAVGFVSSLVALLIGVATVLVSISVLLALWRATETSVDEDIDSYGPYCLLIRRKMSICLYVISAVLVAWALFIFCFIYAFQAHFVGAVVPISMVVCPIFAIGLFVFGWQIYKSALKKWGGDVALNKITKDRQYFWAVTFWGIIPIVIAIILIIVFAFVQPVIRETLYENDDIDAFIRYMETFDNGSEEIYIPLSDLEKTAEFGVIYEYQDGIYYLFKRNVQEVSAHIYWGNPQDNPISQDYAVKYYSDDGSFSVFDARHHAYINADRNFVIELYDSGAAVVHIHTLDLSYTVNIVAIIVIGIDVLICAILCVFKRNKFSVKL